MPPQKENSSNIKSLAPLSEEKVALVLLGITPQVMSLERLHQRWRCRVFGYSEYSWFQCLTIKSPVDFENVHLGNVIPC